MFCIGKHLTVNFTFCNVTLPESPLIRPIFKNAKHTETGLLILNINALHCNEHQMDVIKVIISRYLYITVFRSGESSAC